MQTAFILFRDLASPHCCQFNSVHDRILCLDHIIFIRSQFLTLLVSMLPESKFFAFQTSWNCEGIKGVIILILCQICIASLDEKLEQVYCVTEPIKLAN